MLSWLSDAPPGVIDSILGLLLLSLGGTVVWAIRELPKQLVVAAGRSITVRLSLKGTDDVFDDVMRWLAEVNAHRSRHLRLRRDRTDPGVYGERQKYLLVPGATSHVVWRGLRTVWVKCSVEESKHTMMSMESIDLIMLGRDPQIIRKLMQEIRGHVEEAGVVPVFFWQGWWKPIRRKRMRGLSTVVLRGDVTERVLADLRWFTGAMDWYASRGIPYRRGYLLSGPPGTGKTSLVQALAGELGRPVAILSLSTLDGDRALMEAVINAPSSAIILLEDVDCAQATSKRDTEEEHPAEEGEGEGMALQPIGHATTKGSKPSGKVTLAGLLNTLDGVATPEGRIFVLTTNHPEKLDAALLRPGRADVRIELTYIGATEIQRMAELFYGRKPSTARLPDSISPAYVQECFMRHPDDMDSALQLIERPPHDGPWR